MVKSISKIMLLMVLSSRMAVAEKNTLYVGALFELSNNWYQKYVNFFVDIIEYVFQELENRTDILADYSLKLITKDTQVRILHDIAPTRINIYICYYYY